MSKGSRPKREGPYLWDHILRERGDDKYRVTKDGKKGRRGVDIGMCSLTEYKKSSLTWVLEKILGEFQKEARAVVSDMEKCKSPQTPSPNGFWPDANRFIQ